ncbi:hypothetical protein Bca52824_029310 [Brassica carinata]|uniref:Uncharacterized protein n=1 Tax=Brassica carinata TaxID=52824 RepID=A0A8X8ARE7_BRACI|nr:hypothetical protein Bca52824_029310 [Brassica carinata]
MKHSYETEDGGVGNYDLKGPESFSFKEKLRKSAKGMNEAAEQWVSARRECRLYYVLFRPHSTEMIS